MPEEEREEFWKYMRTDLPNSFRFTGSKAHALAVQERLRNYYIPEITGIQYEGRNVDAPQPVDWYPDRLAWYMTTPKQVIRRFKPFAAFQKFLVAESDVGNITRQEVVSMIPPLVMGVKPGMTVLDLCAAPGSKSAQILELICSGEEDRAREVAHNLANGMARPEGEDFADDGRATGLMVANDVDYKRAHMLVHQMKRLSSPNLIVTNHDATIYPNIRVSSEMINGKAANKYLKFDRILADVPCSGDGTLRKNLEIWKNWTPSNGLGLHNTQVKILIRALQMLKVGGRVVYSTCSMNPVEDEAVLSSAIQQVGGTDIVELVDTKDLLPGLKRFNGRTEWSIMDKAGRMHSNWQSVEDQKAKSGDDGLSRLTESMFPPKDSSIPLNRAMRVYPHSQNTGAFFIAILEKKSEIRHANMRKPESTIEKGGSPTEKTAEVETIDTNGVHQLLETTTDGQVMEIDAQPNSTTSGTDTTQGSSKRKREEEAQDLESSLKRQKSLEASSSALAPSQPSQPRPPIPPKKDRSQPFEEPFKFLSPDHTEILHIKRFYNLSTRFPLDRFMVRNADGTASKNIYYTTALARDILTHNEGTGMKFVHSGVKMFVKQDAPSPETCPWRIQTDGLRILETWVGAERVIKVQKRETLRKLLVEMFPAFHHDDWASLGELGTQMRDKAMGCFVMIVEPSADAHTGGEASEGFAERMVFPLWKSIHSLNLMMPKEDRKAMLLRLFNDDSPLEDMQQQHKQQRALKESVHETEDVAMADTRDEEGRRVRNSSSPEPDMQSAKTLTSAPDGEGVQQQQIVSQADSGSEGGAQL